MSKYEGFCGIVEKFGKKWRWFKYGGYHLSDGKHVPCFKVEPWYEFDFTTPRPRAGETNLTLTIETRGTTYVFPARRMPCKSCDGGIRRQLNLRPHGGVCYCDFTDGTVIDFDYDRMTDEQKIIVATYHYDLQMSSPW